MNIYGYFPTFAMNNNIAYVIFHIGKYICSSVLEVEFQGQRMIYTLFDVV